MSPNPFQDRRTSGLLNRVREDVGHLREDIGNLLSHTTKHTLPDGARELADQAKHRLAAGGAYAADRLRYLKNHPQRQAAGWIGGALLVGAVAAGIYALCRHNGCNGHLAEDEEPGAEEDLPT